MAPPAVPPPVHGAPVVRVDPAAAGRAAAALDALADHLAAVQQADGLRAVAAARDWRGASRHWFDGRHAALVGDLQQAVGRLRRAADEIRGAVAGAAVEQERRNLEATAAHRVEVRRLAALADATTGQGPTR